jgi:DNA modification methylase
MDEGAALREKWGVETGQVWLLGEHRLMCGDSTKAEDVARLMGGEKASCMWTDPPYGVGYVGKTKDALTMQNDGAGNLSELLMAALTNADKILIGSAPFYIAHPAGALQVVFLRVVEAIGWRIHEQLIWVKDSMVLGHSDYHYKHEPILYGWTSGGGRAGRGNHEGSHWYGDNSRVTVFEIPRPKASEEHPTMKPVELVEAHVGNSSRIDEVIYDPFLGSGTTIIACERLGRKCRAIEISPAYCAVAIQRWAEMTGGSPKLEKVRPG